MTKTAILAVVFLIAIAGCVSAPAPSEPVSSEVPAPGFEDVPEMIVAPDAETKDYSISSRTMGKIEDKFTSTTKYTISETFMKIERGEHHTFAIAFTNRLQVQDNFLVSAEFKRAYDTRSNPIDGVDEVQIATWLARNDFSVTPLDINEQSIQSIVVEVVDFADGTSPLPGTYEFDVNVLAQMGLFEVTEEYSGDITVAIQVV